MSEVDLSAPALAAALTTAAHEHAAVKHAAVEHAASGGYGGLGSSSGGGASGTGGAGGAGDAGGAGVGSMPQPAPSVMTGQPNWCGTRALDSSMVSLPPLRLSGGSSRSVGGRSQPTLPPGR